MLRLTHSHIAAFVTGGTLLLTLFGYGAYQWWNNATKNDHVTTVVEIGEVESVVAVSGVIRSNTTTQLGTQASGRITRLPVRENQRVSAGTILAEIDSSQLEIELTEARAVQAEAVAARAELLAGPSEETRQVISTNVTIATEQLERTRSLQTQAINNARRAYLSTDMVALSDNPDQRAPAPLISGTYTCDTEGSYELELYRSQSATGFSFRVSGIEIDTQPVSFTQSVPIGSCGLRAAFTESDFYANARFTIPIPNTTSQQYTTARNRYEAAKLEADTAIAAAEEALKLATQQQARDTATPRSELIAQSDARIAVLDARIARLEQRRSDFIVRAPVDGVVSVIDATVGELVSNQPFITFFGDTDHYELRVRVPEVDITKLAVGQLARIRFDAQAEELLTGSVSALAELPVQVDGVAYFEARVRLDEQPHWLRTGLNADIDLVVARESESLRVPLSYIQHTNGSFSVSVLREGTIETVPITIIVRGTNGYAAISGLANGDVIVAP